MIIGKRERRQLIRLLGELQSILESAIESALVPGTNEALEADRLNVAQDRETWKRAEAWVKRLDAADTGDGSTKARKHESQKGQVR